MSIPTLVYCAAGNRRLADIAIAAGFRYGAQLPRTIYHVPWFVDQDYKRMEDPARRARLRIRYMQALAMHCPAMATVVDRLPSIPLAEVLDWAEEAAQYTEHVLIIPKVPGEIERLPRRINGKTVVLALSVPTQYGGTEVPVWEFAGWPVHLLGGSPKLQMHYWRHLHNVAEVISADGNYHQKRAMEGCQFWTPRKTRGAHNREWPTLQEADGQRWGEDAPYEAFRRSCLNIVAAWQALGSGEVCDGLELRTA